MSYEMIQDSARHLFSKEVNRALIEKVESGVFPEQLWNTIENSGFHRIMCREADGGMQESWEVAFPILHAIGYHQAPVPLAETIIAAFVLSMAEVDIPEGPMTFVTEGKTVGLQVQHSENAIHISGTVSKVPWARCCRHIILPSPQNNQMLLVPLGQDTVSIGQQCDKAKMPLDTVTFNNTKAALAIKWDYESSGESLMQLGALCKSIMIVGALDFAFELSVTYASERRQFGKVIGKNQAIQQQLALMAGNLSSARIASLLAAQDAIFSGCSKSATFAFTSAAAKLRASEAVSVCAGIAHQVHGAIGFTYEYKLNFATRRAWSWREQYGTDSYWANRIGKATIAAGKDDFWKQLIAKTLLD
ncbi:hypothetical protein CAP48_00380 [Advenella sp. S44]|uniref:acyl-CoA dehydrogenase family protein n=1 Tax=Advenella sp. S44 TaxID=1982755 RepID=UPI000C2A68C0|nr:acyl-CoA dehydrogenase family protein [Advenella sp. S44]PJX27691.1 hypothetical protein CAP48_00380 [Advenella sp. S44]